MSAYPSWLQEMIAEALHEVEEYGSLSPETRLDIYEQIDPMESTPPNIHRVRGHLALSALQHVLPQWQHHLPILGDEDDQFPALLVEKIEDVIEGRANLPDMWNYANDHFYVTTNILDEIFEYQENVPNNIAYVAETALKALLESMGLETLKEVEVWSEENEEGGARFTDDAASSAAIVKCGGGDTGIAIDYDGLYDYWRWWLTDALPKAWKSAPQ